MFLVSTTNWHLPSTSTRINSYAAAAANLQHSMKGIQGRDQKQGPLYSGENWQNKVFRWLDIFRSQFYESNSCISSYLENH